MMEQAALTSIYNVKKFKKRACCMIQEWLDVFLQSRIVSLTGTHGVRFEPNGPFNTLACKELHDAHLASDTFRGMAKRQIISEAQRAIELSMSLPRHYNAQKRRAIIKRFEKQFGADNLRHVDHTLPSSVLNDLETCVTAVKEDRLASLPPPANPIHRAEYLTRCYWLGILPSPVPKAAPAASCI